ncbi:hypothetical protein TNIN_402471 [Trichonephila inaurata madagascariensis]|uniref:Uncharacterized protein n=1 Tax=Trichonephila inaurata madagascariensis TaxID=2747483 RepID=A0A8X7CNJ8_9ARAC|nr:hypothetical protein TNIN_402471 [Trichonephila inaurata madagascariensis]
MLFTLTGMSWRANVITVLITNVKTALRQLMFRLTTHYRDQWSSTYGPRTTGERWTSNMEPVISSSI